MVGFTHALWPGRGHREIDSLPCFWTAHFGKGDLADHRVCVLKKCLEDPACAERGSTQSSSGAAPWCDPQIPPSSQGSSDTKHSHTTYYKLRASSVPSTLLSPSAASGNRRLAWTWNSHDTGARCALHTPGNPAPVLQGAVLPSNSAIAQNSDFRP